MNRAKENENKLVVQYNKNKSGVNNEHKQETSPTVPENQ